MKYIVIEIQKAANGNVTTIVNQYGTTNEAESKFHDVMRYAAVSALPVHGAVILNEMGEWMKGEAYEHTVE